MKAYKFYDSWTGVKGIVKGETASKARYKVYLEARECGYYGTNFATIKMTRFPQGDCDKSIPIVKYTPSIKVEF